MVSYSPPLSNAEPSVRWVKETVTGTAMREAC